MKPYFLGRFFTTSIPFVALVALCNGVLAQSIPQTTQSDKYWDYKPQYCEGEIPVILPK